MATCPKNMVITVNPIFMMGNIDYSNVLNNNCSYIEVKAQIECPIMNLKSLFDSNIFDSFHSSNIEEKRTQN